MTKKPQDGSVKDRIIGLLRKGYARSQLITDFDFAERTVDSAIKEYKELKSNDPEESKRGAEAEVQGLALLCQPNLMASRLSFLNTSFSTCPSWTVIKGSPS